MKILDFLTAKPARFFLLAALLWGGLMCYLNEKDGVNFHWHDLLVEANGMLFDLLVFGILLSLYEALREKKDKIERLHEEIDDYRGWDEQEAMYRIVGAIKRLNKEGVTNIELERCFLSKAILSKTILKGAKFWLANLSGADFMEANLSGAYFGEANLSRASFWGANLSGATFMGADLSQAYFGWANLSQADLMGADLSGANLIGADLSGARVGENWFEKLIEWKIIGQEEMITKYLIDPNGNLQLK